MIAFIRRNSVYLLLLVLLGAFVAFGVLLRGWILASSATSLGHEFASLMNQVDRLSGAIDLEIAFMEECLSPSAGEFAERDGDAFASRWERFQREARFPGLLKAAYFFPLRAVRPYRFDPVGRSFVEAGPEDPLAAATDRFEAAMSSQDSNLAQDLRDVLAATADGDSYRVRAVNAVETQDQRLSPQRPDGPYVLRRFERSVGFLIIALDDSALADTVIPSLGREYFGEGSGYGEFFLRAVRPGHPGEEVAVGSAKAPEGFDWTANDFSRPLFSPQTRLNIFGLYVSAHGRPGEGRPEAFGFPSEASDAPIDSFRFLFSGAKGGWLIEAKHGAGSIQRAVGLKSGFESALAWTFLAGAFALIAGLVLSSRRARMLADRERDFIASVSHELKTPIAVILSASENMEKGIIAPERMGAYGSMLAKEGRRLRDSVEGILMVSGLQSAHHGSRSETFPLAELAAESVAKMEDLAAARSAAIALAVEQRPIVKASRAMIGSALTSLVTNALKYGPEGGEVTVRIRAAGPAGRRRAEICVEDRGPGVGYGERARLFDPFWRGSAASASGSAGTGLGLYLARRIARLHSGDVVHRPRPGGGSVFCLSLPEEMEA